MTPLPRMTHFLLSVSNFVLILLIYRTGSIIVAFVVQLKRLENAITPSPDDPDVNQSNDVRYREAGDFIFESVDQGQGMLGKLTGSVINLTLVLGEK